MKTQKGLQKTKFLKEQILIFFFLFLLKFEFHKQLIICSFHEPIKLNRITLYLYHFLKYKVVFLVYKIYNNNKYKFFFIIYNNNDQAINISSIRLAGGDASNYRLNIDGMPGRSFENVTIALDHDLSSEKVVLTRFATGSLVTSSFEESPVEVSHSEFSGLECSGILFTALGNL